MVFSRTILLVASLFFLGCGNTSSTNIKITTEGDLGTTEKPTNGTNNNVNILPKFPHKNEKYQILAWNDLGMHCMDGDDYSVFSILPPFNNLLTQLIKKSTAENKPELISTDVNITYTAVASLQGKYNTSSADKTNFWTYSKQLFNANLKENMGLKGNPAQSKSPAPLHYQATHKWWDAEGIPTVPKDDDGTANEYPMVRVTAKDKEGKVLAETITVLPVSDEMDCKKCHSSKANYPATTPYKGYVNDTDENKDYKYNILRLHDQKHEIDSHLPALKALGYTYKNSLEATARAGTPILCASCHKSNALGTKGIGNIPSLTSSIHAKHSKVIDPSNGKTLNSSDNRDSCYACHPGQKTQCLRGAMGNAKDENGTQKMQCQSCHGNMSAVGKKDREGWLDQPNCQVCHQDGKRHTNAVTDMNKGTLRAVIDNKFATNPDTPAPGLSLYRFSTGHGGLQCASCHGSTHAIYSSSKVEDNLQSKNVQGHAGTINDCKSCHKYVPETTSGGPHGMHTPGIAWVQNHQAAVIENGSEDCKSCHGKEFKGSPLSKMFKTRHMAGKEFKKGKQVSCYDCHDGPTGKGY
ncbi:MAG: hypothetical protein L3J43_08390 [Sulfurovum sp.]|nr:hypothetical protein [Sulfurovum sp.]